MLYGYTGKILRVNLSTRSIDVDQHDEAWYRTYVGGSLMGAYYAFKLIPPRIDAFDPRNVLALMLGPGTGVAFSGNSRATAVAKSPLTNGIGDSQAGGFWPAELRFAGFDGIVIEGAADEPVYLWIHDGTAELRDARHLWGKPTAEAEELIRAELGDDKIEVAQIGPAGEHRVRFAAIMNMSSRAHGRTGMGAVMGAKNLKAIAVRGKARPTVANPAALRTYVKKAMPEYEAHLKEFGELGTAGVIMPQDADGGLPTFNYNSGSFAGAEAISGERMAETILKDRDTCYACIVRCKRVVEANERGITLDPRYGGPEYENLATLGAYCGIDDLLLVAKANELCNMHGMDAIACGATIAWAMECFEHGIITTAMTDGIELRFGNAEAMVTMVDRIARRQGFGDLLAEGSARAAARLGPAAQELLITVKGTELPAHMPQVKRSLALIYAVNPFGADHQSSEHDPFYRPGGSPRELGRLAQIGLTDPRPPEILDEEKVKFAIRSQWAYAALDTLNVCQFVFGPAWQLYDMEDLAGVASAVTGWDLSVEELLRIGERRVNLLRAFNAREGLTRDHDTLPKKLFRPLTMGRSAGLAVGVEEFGWALTRYYELAGWDVTTGTPTASKLRELGLDWVAEQIAA